MDTDIDWNDVIKKEARGNDDLDLGEVQDLAEDKVIVQKGIIDHNIFHIPKSLIKNYDGQVLRFNISEGELKDYEIESSPAPSVREQYLSTTDINSGGGSSGGIHVETDTTNQNDTPPQ